MLSPDTIRAVAVATLMMPFAAQAAGVETAQDLLKICREDDTAVMMVRIRRETNCSAFIEAVLQTHHLLANEAPLYCLPENSAWPIDDIVAKFLGERRDRLDLPAAAMVLAALGTIFPCR